MTTGRSATLGAGCAGPEERPVYKRGERLSVAWKAEWEQDWARSDADHRRLEDTKMHMSNESLLIILGVGLIAGWLAGQFVQGTGFGIVGDLIIGIVGAFIGSCFLNSASILARALLRRSSTPPSAR